MARSSYRVHSPPSVRRAVKMPEEVEEQRSSWMPVRAWSAYCTAPQTAGPQLGRGTCRWFVLVGVEALSVLPPASVRKTHAERIWSSRCSELD